MKEIFGQNLQTEYDKNRNWEPNFRKNVEKDKSVFYRVDFSSLIDDMVQVLLVESSTHTYLLKYDEHQERLKECGYDRGFSALEVNSLIMAMIEGKLKDKSKKLAQEMIKNQGEYLCDAIRFHDKMLCVYHKPYGLEWSEDRYKFIEADDGSFCQNKDIFKSPKLKKGWNKISDINKSNPDLVSLLYGRKFDKLPEEIRKGDSQAKIFLPDDGKLWPLVLEGQESYNLECSLEPAASRGVKRIR